MTTTITESATPTIEHVAPDALTIEDNVREAVDLPKEFVASIKQHGVLVPVRAVRLADGSLAVRDGQRRVLAARDAGVGVVPAYVVDVGDEKARVLEQLVTNDQRDALTEHDRVQGYAALHLAGMSSTAIAKATGTKKARVDQSIAVASNIDAAVALNTPGVTLEFAAALVEFEGNQELQSRILAELERSPDGGEWIVRRARQDHDRAARVEAIEGPLRAAGVRIIAESDTYGSNSAERLDHLTDAEELDEDGRYPALTVKQHTSCEGRAVAVLTHSGVPTAVEYCTTPRVHRSKWTGLPMGGSTKGPMTDEQKAERKVLVARNKAWDVAEPVRREWLAEFVQRRSLPKDATAFAAVVLVGRAHQVEAFRVNEMRRVFIPDAIEAKPTHALVALAIAFVEGYLGRDTWRSPRDGDAEYFAQLEAWGYPLSDVERVVAESGAGS